MAPPAKLIEAFQLLDQNELVHARRTEYGIAVDVNGRFIQCGFESRGVSMSVYVENSCLRWYQRFDFVELGELITGAFEQAHDKTRESIAHSISEIDAKYDHEKFDRWLSQFIE